jgi:hypothetical protein
VKPNRGSVGASRVDCATYRMALPPGVPQEPRRQDPEEMKSCWEHEGSFGGFWWNPHCGWGRLLRTFFLRQGLFCRSVTTHFIFLYKIESPQFHNYLSLNQLIAHVP